eukprot:jgi/Botrbrau1/23656/Bobra.55_2s0039.1
MVLSFANRRASCLTMALLSLSVSFGNRDRILVTAKTARRRLQEGSSIQSEYIDQFDSSAPLPFGNSPDQSCCSFKGGNGYSAIPVNSITTAIISSSTSARPLGIAAPFQVNNTITMVGAVLLGSSYPSFIKSIVPQMGNLYVTFHPNATDAGKNVTIAVYLPGGEDVLLNVGQPRTQNPPGCVQGVMFSISPLPSTHDSKSGNTVMSSGSRTSNEDFFSIFAPFQQCGGRNNCPICIKIACSAIDSAKRNTVHGRTKARMPSDVPLTLSTRVGREGTPFAHQKLNPQYLLGGLAVILTMALAVLILCICKNWARLANSLTKRGGYQVVGTDSPRGPPADAPSTEQHQPTASHEANEGTQHGLDSTGRPDVIQDHEDPSVKAIGVINMEDATTNSDEQNVFESEPAIAGAPRGLLSRKLRPRGQVSKKDAASTSQGVGGGHHDDSSITGAAGVQHTFSKPLLPDRRIVTQYGVSPPSRCSAPPPKLPTPDGDAGDGSQGFV